MHALKPQRRRVSGLLIATTLALGLIAPGAAGAASPTQVAPKRGAVLALGSQPVFKVRDATAIAGGLTVWITISRSKRLQADGDLKNVKGTFSSMKRRGSIFRYKPLDYTFPSWFMARRGTYYWQAYRIDCAAAPDGCHVHTRVRSFKVR